MGKKQEVTYVTGAERHVGFPFHAKSKEDCLVELGIQSKDYLSAGLTSAEAAARLAKYGPNRLSEKEKTTLLQRIWHQVNNVLVGVLVFVAIVAGIQAVRYSLVGDNENTVTNAIQVGLIFFVIFINTCIGIYQEGSAEKAADALKAMLSADALVTRDGKDQKIPAENLVPGDLIKLNLGDRVPSDLRMVQVNNLAALEAALTGESVPIDKTVEMISVSEHGQDPMNQPLGDRHNMCYSATLVASGFGAGIVCYTGDYTEIGTINRLVNKVEAKKTNVLMQIDYISKWLAFFIFWTSLGVWFAAFFMANQPTLDALSTALVCSVAMIPEGLEAIVTMTYAWSVSNMAKNNAIIRALPAVETLGSVTTICSDKTGTLTKNEMTLVAFCTAGKRYRFWTDAKDRTPTNFAVNESYMATRADHSKYLKSAEIIKKGPSADRKSGKGSFPFGITTGFGKTAHGGVEPEEPTHMVNEDGAPDEHAFVPGEAPATDYLRKALCGGILCSKCQLGEGGGRKGEIGNPTELAILRAAYFGDINVSEVKNSAPILAEVPFSSEYKFMATVHEPTSANDGSDYDDSLIVHVKGAPDRLIPLCKYQAKEGVFDKNSLEECETKMWIEQIAVLSSHGLRVLALTRGTTPKGSVTEGQQLKADFVQRGEPWLTIVGLCAIMDPPRPECVKAIQLAHGAGVRVAMITGDHKDTALAIGGMLGLLDKTHTEAITGPEMDAMSDEELRLAVQKYNVFARASPQNKIKIVKALQSDGEVCGMTGDGVNDAPALKAADMGVAMGKEGTDVAREASDMILADDNFATIVTAVREGRVVWDNLRKVLLVNTPINNAQGMTVLFGILFGLPYTPLSSIQVLYSNLICACTLGFVTAVEPAEDGIMDQPPRRIGKRLVGRFLFLRIMIATIIMLVCTVGAVFLVKGHDEDKYGKLQQRGLALNVLNFGACSVCASARFARKSAFHVRSFQNSPIALFSYALMVVLQVFTTYTPGVNRVIFSQSGIDGFSWGLVAASMAIVLIVMEFEKAVCNYLTYLKYDTADKEFDEVFDDASPPTTAFIPAEVNRFGKNEMTK